MQKQATNRPPPSHQIQESHQGGQQHSGQQHGGHRGGHHPTPAMRGSQNNPRMRHPRPTGQQQGGQEGGQRGRPYHSTQAIRIPQNNSTIRFSTSPNSPMCSPRFIQPMYIQPGQPRLPTFTYSQTAPMTAQHTAEPQSVQTSHVVHAPQQQYYQYPQIFTMTNGIPQGQTHPQTVYVAYEVPRPPFGTSQMSYGVQQPVYMGPIGQSAINPQQVHGMTQPAQQQQQQIAHQQQASNQQVQQQKQHHAQAFPPRKLYKRPVEQSNVGQTRRGSSDGGPQGGNVVGHTGGSGQPKEITPIVVRKKKILPIIDPTSGKNVIDAPVSTGPPERAETVKEDDKSKSETPEVSVATPMSSVVSGIVGNGGRGDSLTSSTEASTPPQTAATDDSSSNTSDIKTEFFNKISQANDDKKKSDENKPVEEFVPASTATTLPIFATTPVTVAAPTASTPTSSETPTPVVPVTTTTPTLSTTTTAVSKEEESSVRAPTVDTTQGQEEMEKVEEKSEAPESETDKAAVAISATTTTGTTTPPEVADNNNKTAPFCSLPDEPKPSDVKSEQKIEISKDTTTFTSLSTLAVTTTSTPVVDEKVTPLLITKVETQNTTVEDSGSVGKVTNSLSELTVTKGEKIDDEDEEDAMKESNQDPRSEQHDMSTVSISPTPIEAYCDLSMTSRQGSTVDDTSFYDDTNELNPAQNLADEPQDSRSDNDEVEDGEIPVSDKDDDEEGKAPKVEANAPKKIRKYDRDFLLQVGQSLASKKINDIGIADVLRTGGSNKDQGGYPRTLLNAQHGRYGRMPPKDRLNPMGPPLNLGGHSRGWTGLGQPMSIPPTLPSPRAIRVIDLQMNVKLNRAENAWKPSHAVRGRGGGGGGGSSGDSEASADEKLTLAIVKQTRGILNKLTPENFSKLRDKFLKFELNDMDDRISAVINVVFEKAIDEPNFSSAYARMVQHVCMNSQETAKKFRKEILDQCQKEFQKTNKDEDEIKSAEAEISNAPEDKKEQLKLQLEEKRTQMRRRSLGNVRFIGELYKLQMLTPKIMVDCVQMLINSQDEESYECLCKLLTTVGQKLDNQLKELEQRIRQAKSTNQQLPKFIPDDKFMDKKFVKLKQLSSDTAKLSSRIRFALLDVVELRENDWKPRRDSNAPKTIDEVRREALLQDQEEKRQINALPDPTMGRARRSSPQTPQQLQLQQKKMGNDWNTVQSNKSSRFSAMTKAKSSEPILGGSPVLAPMGVRMGGWRGGQPQNRSNSGLPPRLQNQQEQQQNPMSSSFGGQQSHNNNSGHLPQQQQIPNRFGPSMGSSSQSPNRFNMLSHQTSQPASQPPPPPQHQQQQSSNIPEVLNLEPPTPEVNETVKNIFFEYCSVKKYEDTMHWVKERFPGDKVITFVDCLARQVGEMSKPEFQCGAGQLIKMLIKHKLIRRDLVLRVLTEGLIPDIPDIQVDCPKVTTYVAVFILEVFGNETNFNWLLELTRPLKEEEETMTDLIRVTLNQLQLKENEEYVKSLWKMTDERDSISDDCLPWPKEESITSLVNKIVPVLQKHGKEDIVKIYHENTWDMREVEVCAATLLATCEVSFVNRTWKIPVLEKCLALFSNKSTPVPNVWKHAKEFIKNKRGTRADEEILWTRLQKLNRASNKDRI